MVGFGWVACVGLVCASRVGRVGWVDWVDWVDLVGLSWLRQAWAGLVGLRGLIVFVVSVGGARRSPAEKYGGGRVSIGKKSSFRACCSFASRECLHVAYGVVCLRICSFAARGGGGPKLLTPPRREANLGFARIASLGILFGRSDFERGDAQKISAISPSALTLRVMRLCVFIFCRSDFAGSYAQKSCCGGYGVGFVCPWAGRAYCCLWSRVRLGPAFLAKAGQKESSDQRGRRWS